MSGHVYTEDEIAAALESATDVYLVHELWWRHQPRWTQRLQDVACRRAQQIIDQTGTST